MGRKTIKNILVKSDADTLFLSFPFHHPAIKFTKNITLKMIANIDPKRSAIASILSALIGTWYNFLHSHIASFTLIQANTAFQHLAWTVAIIAGLVSIINGVRSWKLKNPKK